MIVTNIPHPTKNHKLIAETEDGERAYHTQPTSIFQYGRDSYPNQEALSASGAPWLPSFLPDHRRLTIFIAGNPGAGKSYLSRRLIELFPPDADVLLFTALEEDDGNFDKLDKAHFFKIKMDVETLSSMTLGKIREACKVPILLFDDIDKIRDKKIEKLVYALMEDALANGRGHRKHDGRGDIHVIVTSHNMNNFLKTKFAIENSDYKKLD